MQGCGGGLGLLILSFALCLLCRSCCTSCYGILSNGCKGARVSKSFVAFNLRGWTSVRGLCSMSTWDGDL